MSTIDDINAAIAALRAAAPHDAHHTGTAFLGNRDAWRAVDALRRAKLELESAAERGQEDQRRIILLSSSNGDLMVDRDRVRVDAARRVNGAWDVARNALAAAGIDSGDLAEQVAEQVRYSDQQWAALGAERDRLEAFRLAMVGVLMALDGRNGLDARQVGVVRRAIERGNNKACGRS